MVDKPICRICSVVLNDENWSPSSREGNHRICKPCACKKSSEWWRSNPDKVKASHTRWMKANPDKVKASRIRHKRKEGQQLFNENRGCPLFLGVHVAERVLSHVFKDVERMPMSNPGFDFICNRGKKIDVKSACKRKDGGWDFRIKRNTIADYFLCLAFDDRESLTILYAWLLPSGEFCHFVGVSIRPSTIRKWDEYQLDIGKIITCCDMVRGG